MNKHEIFLIMLQRKEQTSFLSSNNREMWENFAIIFTTSSGKDHKYTTVAWCDGEFEDVLRANKWIASFYWCYEHLFCAYNIIVTFIKQIVKWNSLIGLIRCHAMHAYLSQPVANILIYHVLGGNPRIIVTMIPAHSRGSSLVWHQVISVIVWLISLIWL